MTDKLHNQIKSAAAAASNSGCLALPRAEKEVLSPMAAKAVAIRNCELALNSACGNRRMPKSVKGEKTPLELISIKIKNNRIKGGTNVVKGVVV